MPYFVCRAVRVLSEALSGLSETAGDARDHAAGRMILLIVSKRLGHFQVSKTERYAHLADDPARRAADALGNRIAAALGGKSGEVVGLHRVKKQ